MEALSNKMSFEEIEHVIDILNPCVDDYLFVLNLKNGHYVISENAMDRFPLPAADFPDYTVAFTKVVYEEDLELLSQDLTEIVSRKKGFHNLRYRWKDKEGKPVWINCRGNVLVDEEGRPELITGCINEIGKKQQADNVRGLLGETSLRAELSELIKNDKGVFLRIGIDNFKDINENKGMEYGDMILHKTAGCIRSIAGSERRIYRLVADEFLIFGQNGTAESAVDLYRAIREGIDDLIEKIGYDVFYTISAGILPVSAVQDRSSENILKLSEFALAGAKEAGKNTYVIYKEEDYQKFLDKKELIHTMRKSVNQNFEGFEAYFQPIVDIKSQKLVSAETLLRFRTKERMVSPAEFIPLLEESGLIIPVGRFVLHQALKACGQIQKYIPDFRISVNVSYIQVLKSDMLTEILSAISIYKIKRGSLIIELTESGFLECDANFRRFCDGLKKSEIPLALDDFGTGYSNFHYLYNLNPDTIKIDRSFTLKALNNGYEYILLQHMVEMTHSIDLKLCVEGIETKQELDKISRIEPDYIQGYFFGRPCSFSIFMESYVTGESKEK